MRFGTLRSNKLTCFIRRRTCATPSPSTCSRYELSFVLLTYALALSNSATAAVQALGTYERDASVSEGQRKRSDEQINMAADTLCRAAGVLKYLSEVVIPDWEALTPDLRGRPPEITKDVTMALSKWVGASSMMMESTPAPTDERSYCLIGGKCLYCLLIRVNQADTPHHSFPESASQMPSDLRSGDCYQSP